MHLVCQNNAILAHEHNLIATFEACLLLPTQPTKSITRLFWLPKTAFFSNVKKVAIKELFYYYYYFKEE